MSKSVDQAYLLIMPLTTAFETFTLRYLEHQTIDRNHANEANMGRGQKR